jgi:CRISPR-associated protein Csm3
MNTFWQFENRWLITATLRMKTALSVGSRASLLPAGSDLPVIKTPEGVPFIPGSSLKGVIRTYVERVLRTLDGMKHAASRTAPMGM